MITPNKLIPLSDSSLGHVDKIFNGFEGHTSVRELYKKLRALSNQSIFLFMRLKLYIWLMFWKWISIQG